MADEKPDRYGVVIITKGGISGLYREGTMAECLQYKDRIMRYMAEEQADRQDRRIHFDPFGMGMGAPCPVGAIKNIIIMAPGDPFPEEEAEKHIAHATRFHEELAKAEARKSEGGEV